MEVVDAPDDASVKSEGDDSSVFSDPQPIFFFAQRNTFIVMSAATWCADRTDLETAPSAETSPTWQNWF